MDQSISKEFNLNIGCKNGDPASPIFFIIDLDKCLRGVVEPAHIQLNIPIGRPISPIPVGGYADDIMLISLLEKVFLSMVKKFKDNIKGSSLTVPSDKCGIFYERRSANRWYKAKSDKLPEIEFSGKIVEVLKRHEEFVYLGKPLTVAGKSASHVKEIIETFSQLLDKIVTSVTLIAIKLEALKVIALSKIIHHFADTQLTEQHLNELDTLLVKSLRKILSLNHSTTVRTCLKPKSKGGLGVRKPSIVYTATRLVHLIFMLDHLKPNIRFVARNNLSIDMKKQGVVKVCSSDISNFLGYKCKENGLIETNIKGGFGVTSDWPYLNQLARKMDITTEFEQCPAENLLDARRVRVVLSRGDAFNGSIKTLRSGLIFQ